MTKAALSILLFLVAAIEGHADRQIILVNSDNMKCRIDEHTNYGNDGGGQKVFWVFADYVTNTYDKFEAFLVGSYNHQEAAAGCKLIDELLSESLATGGNIEVEAKTATYTTRIQGDKGSVWVPRPACYYDIYTTVVQTLEFPKNLVLKHETSSKERFTDECR